MKRFISIFILFAGLATQPLHAQMTGTRMGGRPAREPARLVSPQAIPLLMKEYAACLIAERRKPVETFLATPPNSAASDRQWYAIKSDQCLSTGFLTLTEASLRGAAYERLYQIDFASRGPIDFAATPPLDYARGLDLQQAADRGNVASRQFADCVVRSAPADARSLVLSRLGSAEERGGFARLVPLMQYCVEQGATIDLNKQFVRGLVAETLYRLSRAPAVGGAKPVQALSTTAAKPAASNDD